MPRKKKVQEKVEPFETQKVINERVYELIEGEHRAKVEVSSNDVVKLTLHRVWATSAIFTFNTEETQNLIKIIRRIVEIYDALATLREMINE